MNTTAALARQPEVTSTSVADPVLVLGFGRSGTTWIADIISRTTGKLILFEPFHPSVLEESVEVSYRPLDPTTAPVVAQHINDILNGANQRPWLLRNHIPVRLDDVPDHLLDLVWKECEVLGFKAIRQNFQIDWLGEHVSRRIAFIMRHPYGVVASILRRSNFWEFGWPGTFELMMEQTVHSESYDGTPLAQLRAAARSAATDVERIALMWTATHLSALPALRELGLTPHHYSEFLASPFTGARKLLASLDLEADVHPCQIFSPSMTAEISAVARHGLVDEPEGRRASRTVGLDRADRLAIDRIVEPVRDLVDLGQFDENASLGA
jgi:hypothetical protein